MPVTVHDFIDHLATLAPLPLAAQWDNVGLLVGHPETPVNRVLLGLDPTPALLDQAITQGAELLITHHPIIFHPVHTIQHHTPQGALLRTALQHNLNIIACHTNFDAAPQGVSHQLATALGLEAIQPLIPAPAQVGIPPDSGTGCLGQYSAPLTSQQFLARLEQACQPPWLLDAGKRPKTIRHVALCGGSGSGFAPQAHAAGADVYITGELKHDTCCWAEAANIWLIDAGHFATEAPAMFALAKQLTKAFETTGQSLVIETASQQSPLRLMSLNMCRTQP